MGIWYTGSRPCPPSTEVRAATRGGSLCRYIASEAWTCRSTGRTEGSRHGRWYQDQGRSIKTDRVRIESSESTETGICEVYKLSHAPTQVSRRPIGQTFGRYRRIHFDLSNFHLDIIDICGRRTSTSRASDSTGYTLMLLSQSIEKPYKSSLLWSRTGGTYRLGPSTIIPRCPLERMWKFF